MNALLLTLAILTSAGFNCQPVAPDTAACVNPKTHAWVLINIDRTGIIRTSTGETS